MLIFLWELYYQNCSGFETVSKIPQWWLISTSLLRILSIIYEYSGGYSCDPWKSVIYNIYKKNNKVSIKILLCLLFWCLNIARTTHYYYSSLGPLCSTKTGHHNFLYSCLSPLLLMVHRTPPFGLSVSLSSCIILFCPGNSVNSNSCSNRAISTRASNWAKVCPMQVLGPTENG